MASSTFGVCPNGDEGENESKTMTTAVREETELERIERWRREELERGGFPQEAAKQIARRHDIDLRAAIAMLERGCTPELALQILL